MLVVLGGVQVHIYILNGIREVIGVMSLPRILAILLFVDSSDYEKVVTYCFLNFIINRVRCNCIRSI